MLNCRRFPEFPVLIPKARVRSVSLSGDLEVNPYSSPGLKK